MGDLPEGDHEVEFTDKIRSYGHFEKVTRDLSVELGRILNHSFGERAQFFDAEGSKINFNPRGPIGSQLEP